MSWLNRIRWTGGRPWLWGAPLVLWLAFTVWYTNTGGPLSAAEIDAITAGMERGGAPRESIERLRRFMTEDAGDQFLMANLLDLAAGDGAQEDMDRYMAHMIPALLSRASHPVLAGPVVFPAMDMAGMDGVQGAENWTSVGVVRYRSRRDLLAIALDPVFDGEHEFKVAALAKTIAVPVEPTLYLGDPRVLLLLVLLAAAGVADALVYRRRR